VLRKLVLIMWVPVVLAVLYSAWTFWQRRAPNPPPKPVAAARDPLADYGSAVTILQFYTTAGEIAGGQKALVCYGVVNAASVRLDPPVEKVWPAVSRCFEVAPTRSTRYTLTAEDANHQTVSKTIEIRVKGAQ
jgi:hypothetical protein